MSRRETVERRLAVVGAGKIGTAVARAAVANGYDVAISGSGAPERIELIVDVLAPGAHAVTTDEVVRHAALIVLAVPMHRFRELPRDLFAGKILVDAMNYWEQIDGVDEELATAPTGTSVIVQQHFSSAQVVKSLNHLGYFMFSERRRPRGAPGRLALAAAGDDQDAVDSDSTPLTPGHSLPASRYSQVGRCSASPTATTNCRTSFGPRRLACDREILEAQCRLGTSP
jgi:hypothetical protein